MRILLVASTAPGDSSFGGGQRTSLVHRALSLLGEVSTLVVKVGRTSALARKMDPFLLGEIVFSPPPPHRKYSPHPDVETLCRELLNFSDFDLIVGRELYVAATLPASKTPTIVDADDAYYNYAPEPNRPLSTEIAWLRSNARRVASSRALSRFDHVWFSCQRDKSKFGIRRSTIVPNIPHYLAKPTLETESNSFDGDASCEVRGSPIILFVGALWYGPNIHGVAWFIRECWPLIQASAPETILRVVGAGPQSVLQRWREVDNVQCPGFVQSIDEEYAHARFTIAPISYGGGTQIKVLESLAFGRASVTTPFVASGFHPTLPPESLICCSSAEQMARMCLRVLADPAEAREIAMKARRIVLENYRWENFRDACLESARSVAAERSVRSNLR